MKLVENSQIASGFVPAFGAYRARITDMLRPA